MTEATVGLTNSSLKRFAVSKIYRPEDSKKNSRITGIDFSRDGQFVITSGSDDTVKLYSSIDGEHKKTFYVRKYGAQCVRFTHHNKAILAAGARNQDCCIRYHSLHDNSYLRTFRGHQLPINNLVLSPISDTFLTSSKDQTVRMWDIRQEGAVALVRVKHKPTVAFDNEGLIFAIGASRSSLKLFDIRNFGAGAFTTWYFDLESRSEWCSMEFSPNSKYVLINTNQNFLMCLDAFTGKVAQTYHSHENSNNVNLHGSFTPDSNYVCCGSTSGDIHLWARDSAEEVAVWHGHPEPVAYTRWNPMRAVCASAGTNLGFWISRPMKGIVKKTVTTA